MTATASTMADLPSIEHKIQEPEIFQSPRHELATSAIGTLQHAILPSLGLHGGLSVIAYGVARATNRVDIKDYLWPSGMVLNAWWTAVGRHTLLAPHAPIADVIRGLSYSQKLLLGGVTAWGGRLFYRIVKRSLQRGKDDARYEQVKDAPNFWNKATLLFGLEAVFQTAISLPFTLPFCADVVTGFFGASIKWASTVRWVSAGLFTTGLALETIADWQIDAHKQREIQEKKQGKPYGEVLRTGVWSIVRHPNYLGDAVVHLAFPLWCYGSQLFTLPQALGPAANYFFLRWIGGDCENEASQVERYAKEDKHKHAQLELYQLQKHSFWPSFFELGNRWTWIMAGIGAAGAAAEYFYESRLVAAVTATNPVNAAVGETIAGLN